MNNLDLWLTAAEAIRSTCENLEEFDALIAEYRERRNDPA